VARTREYSGLGGEPEATREEDDCQVPSDNSEDDEAGSDEEFPFAAYAVKAGAQLNEEPGALKETTSTEKEQHSLEYPRHSIGHRFRRANVECQYITDGRC